MSNSISITDANNLIMSMCNVPFKYSYNWSKSPYFSVYKENIGWPSEALVRGIMLNGFGDLQKITLGSIASYDLHNFYSCGDQSGFTSYLKKNFNPKANKLFMSQEKKDNLYCESLCLDIMRFDSKPNVSIKNGFNFRHPKVGFISGEIDGIGYIDNKPKFVIEIKSINPLKTQTIQKFFIDGPDNAPNESTRKRLAKQHRENNYIDLDDKGKWYLKQNNTHYHQLQMAMFALNLDYSYLVFYSKFKYESNNDDYLHIKVYKDINYINYVMPRLELMYFNYVLPVVGKIFNK